MAMYFVAPIYILLNGYILWRFVRYLGAVHRKLKHPVIRAVVIVIYVFFMLTPLTGYLITTNPYHRILKMLSNYWIGILAVTLVILLLFDLGRLILNHTIWKKDHPSDKRMRIGGTIALVLIIGLSTAGFIHAKTIDVNRQEVTINKEIGITELNSDGNLRIALVSDLHIGYNVGTAEMQQMVDKINAEDPDLVIISGDIFDNSYDAIEDPDEIADILASIKSTYGTYAVWGNHDIAEQLLGGFTVQSEEYEDDSRFEQLLAKSGITLLEDESVLIDDSFYLVGRKDAARAEKLGEECKTIEELTSGLDQSKPIFVLDHEPKELEETALAGADLDLSGHTHNGQIFPGNLFLDLKWENPYGLKEFGDMTSIVTSGAGIWGPAMRLGTNSEVMVIDVNSSSQSSTE